MSMRAHRTAALAAESIIIVGGPLTLRRRSEGAYNTATGSGAVTEVDTTVTGFVAHYSDAVRDGTVIQVGDCKALLSAKNMSVVPMIADRLVDSTGKVFQVIRVQVIAIADHIAAYSLQLRH